MRSILLFLVGAATVLAVTTTALVKLPPNFSVPAILAFGDSLVDTGNNNYIRTMMKCNFRPYGENFEGRIPTGRFCDGKVPSDIIAGELGIKDTVPAYLEPNLHPEDLITGVCFASGGTGYDPMTSELWSVISLSDQLKYFEEYILKLEGLVGENKTKFIIANSAYLVVASSNDIANTYFLLRARNEFDVPAYINFISSRASDFLQELHRLGARRIAVFGAPPLGCMPSQRTVRGGPGRECAEDENLAARLFNSKLTEELSALNRRLPNSNFIYVDVYNPLLDLIQNPGKYGFEDVGRGCCGTGDLEASVLCNPSTPMTCANVSNHVFWDSYHPTESAYRTLIVPNLQKYVNQFYRGI